MTKLTKEANKALKTLEAELHGAAEDEDEVRLLRRRIGRLEELAERILGEKRGQEAEEPEFTGNPAFLARGKRRMER